jgi:hypothetical protein
VLESIGDGEIRSSLAGVRQDDRITPTLQISPTSRPDDRITRRGLHSTGGIGHVWLAYDKVLDREIALKELKANQAVSSINRERFFREAQITAQLTHPGTVPVYDYVEDGERSYYTMKFVRGRTLTEKIVEYHDWRRQTAQNGVTTRLVQLLNQFISVLVDEICRVVVIRSSCLTPTSEVRISPSPMLSRTLFNASGIAARELLTSPPAFCIRRFKR